jgi:hypothetical protein
MMKMDSEFLSAIGQHIYGENWKKPLAKAIGLSDRQIARYVNEGHKLNGTLRDGRPMATLLYDLMAEHDKATQKLIVKLSRMTPREGKDFRR